MTYVTIRNNIKKGVQNGSHIKLKNQRTGRQVIVPFHSKAMKKGLEQAILKEAGLKCRVNKNGGSVSE